MRDRYEHTQPGALMRVVLLVGAFVFAAAAYMNAGAGRWIALVVALGFVVLAWLFSSLTVVVGEEELRWYFGPGLWKYRIPVSDITAVQTVRNTVFDGFGIRMRPGFRLFNVSGLDAVELRLTSGEVRRLGTDDAAGLAAALKS